MRGVWTDDNLYEAICRDWIAASAQKDQSLLRKLLLQYAPDSDLELLELMVQEVDNRMHVYDFITPFMADPRTSEIMINGCQQMFVETAGITKEYETNVSEKRLTQLIQKIMAEVNRSANLKTPITDARLKDGSRVNVVMKPIAINGPILTIRRFNQQLSTLEELLSMGMINENQMHFLRRAVKEKKSIFVSGGTSTGKTTLLNCLCNEINAQERIITVEDSAELQISKVRNLVSLECRAEHSENLAMIDLRQLIKSALRMRPDRIVVGEIRGPEAFEMLQALNTGHAGSMSTGHSNTASDMLLRIESMAMMAEVPLSVIKAQIGSGIDYVVHLDRLSGRRLLSQVLRVKPHAEAGYAWELVHV